MSSRISLRSLLCVGLWLTFLLSSLAFAQALKSTPSSSVLASASTEQVHFTALGETIQVRLEVFSVAGVKLYDSDFKSGNLLDWNLLDQQGQRLLDGSYRCLVTSKTLAGQTSQKQGLLVLQAGQAAFQPPDQDSLALFSANSSTPLERADFLTIVNAETNWPLTLVAHDGEQGRVVSGRGGLSFRTGDSVAGKDREQMQLTPDGKLGLGVAEPQAKLDVGGLIRTSEGIVFPDGSVQTTAYVASGHSLNERNRTQREAQGRTITERDDKAAGSEKSLRVTTNISGSGTTNRVTKWLDGPNGVVGDSAIFETSGRVGIGTTTPGFPLTFTNTLGDKISLWGQSGNHYGFGIQNSLLQIHGGGSADDIAFGYGSSAAFTETMRIKGTGNVGIGVTSPLAKLHVDGGSSIGVYGVGNGGFGVLGESSSGWAGYFVGKAYVSGNLGIGTTPGFKLDVADRMRVRQGASASAGIWFYQNTPAADRAFVGMKDDDEIGFYGNNGAGWGITMDTYTGNVGIGAAPNLFDQLFVSGGNAYAVTGMSNSVGVFGQADNANSYGVWGYSVNGRGIYGSSNNGYAGYFDNNVHVNGTLTQSSDARLKQDVVSLGYGLREVLQLRPVTWHWKNKPAGKLQLGLIAQEVQQVLPELVVEDKDEAKTLSLNYLGLAPILIKAVQEQQTALEQKEAAIKALQQRNAELDARLTALEQTLQQLLGQSQPSKRQ